MCTYFEEYGTRQADGRADIHNDEDLLPGRNNDFEGGSLNFRGQGGEKPASSAGNEPVDLVLGDLRKYLVESILSHVDKYGTADGKTEGHTTQLGCKS